MSRPARRPSTGTLCSSSPANGTSSARTTPRAIGLCPIIRGCRVLGRSESEVSRVRRRYGKDPLGNDAWRTDSEQHDHHRVNGRQYVAVVTGLGAITANLFSQAEINPQHNNAIHAFALRN